MIKEIYNKLYLRSPKNIQGHLSKAVFSLTNKPSIKQPNSIQKFPNGAKGCLIISADFELAWAWRYTKKDKNSYSYALKKAKQERENIPVILKCLEDFNIPITWATVGHLFLDGCQKDDHSWMSRIPHFDNHWKFLEGDWFDYDPHTTYKEAPEWYAPDLVEMILKSKTNHEVGCHSFSHMNFRNNVCPAEVADDEISASIEAAKKFGIVLKSMVFPGGTFGNFNSLVKYGFTNYRRSFEYELFYPEKDSFGLVRLPSSFSMEDFEFKWDKEYYLKRYKKYIDKAVETGTVCHAWFHPSESVWMINEIFPEIFNYISNLREKGLLHICTMNEMSEVILLEGNI